MFPIMIDIENKHIVVIGGGSIAYRKVKKLLEYGAKVLVVGESVKENIYKLKEIYNEKINIIESVYRKAFIEDAYMVIGATSNGDVNRKIAEVCKEKNILCSIVDNKEMSDFIFTSVLQRGDLSISISTNGKSPSLCSKIKRDLEGVYTEKYEEIIDLLGDVRNLIILYEKDEKVKRVILRDIIDMNLEELQEFYIKLKKEYEDENSCRE